MAEHRHPAAHRGGHAEPSVGHKCGIAGVYNRATYDGERAAGPRQVGAHIKLILAQTHWKKSREVRAAG